MVTKARARAKTKGHEYIIVSGGKVKTVIARNIREAGVKAKRLFLHYLAKSRACY